jgi:hypothetical protein
MPGRSWSGQRLKGATALKKLQIIVLMRTATRMWPMEIASALGYRSAIGTIPLPEDLDERIAVT